MNNALIQLLVLAGIAVFLILKLRSVLGSREGFEKPPLPAEEVGARPAQRAVDAPDAGPDRDITDHAPEGSAAALALSQMKQAEPSFAVGTFLQGARGAYEMILMAFETGDLEKVRPFLAPEVFAAFDGVVQDRLAKGLKTEAEFVGLRELVLQNAEFDPASREGEITVRFGGELISVVRDGAGAVVEGDPRSPRKQRDIWTFARKMGASDPNWQLVATGG